MIQDFFSDNSRFLVPVRDPVWKHIWMTEAISSITRSTPFMRLYRIKQLGPTELLYPGATHSRASHSIGVYHLALKILKELLARGADKWVTRTGCYSFLCAALLHDIGHFPYTHSLKELPLQDHEELSAALIMQSELQTLIDRAGGNPEQTARIIDKKESGRNTETDFFAHILSGVLDPDKLDYLNRDAYYCGVPYGLQDVDFILSRIQPDKNKGITLDSKAVMSIESILFSKYLMYRSVYWHKQIRIATAMMKKALYLSLQHQLLVPEQLYSIDDQGLYQLIRGLPEQIAQLANGVQQNALYSLVGEYTCPPDNPVYHTLEHIDSRNQLEANISERLSMKTGLSIKSSDIIIDIPERVSFESDLFITDERLPFSLSSTVFSEEIVTRFTTSLRKIRIAVSPSIFLNCTSIPDIDSLLAEWAGVR